MVFILLTSPAGLIFKPLHIWSSLPDDEYVTPNHATDVHHLYLGLFGKVKDLFSQYSTFLRLLIQTQGTCVPSLTHEADKIESKILKLTCLQKCLGLLSLLQAIQTILLWVLSVVWNTT